MPTVAIIIICKPNFFKLADGGEIELRPLMPRFKKKLDGEQSFRLPFADCEVIGDRVSLPKKTGWIRYDWIEK